MKKEFRDPADRVVAGAAALVIVLAALALVGWLFNRTLMRSLTPAWSPMAPLTAVLFILLALSLVWDQRRRAWANLAMAACCIIAGAVLAEYLFDVQLGLQAAMRALDRISAAPLPELPAPDTSAAVILLVVALLCYRTSRSRLHDFADVVAVVIGMVCLQVLLAYLYNVVFTGGSTGFRQIAPRTTLSMMVLAFAATARRPTLGIYGAMRGNAQSAVQLRRLLPTTILFCAVMGWFFSLSMRERLASLPELVSWTVIGATVLLAILLFITSADMRQAETTVRRRQEELLAAKVQAEAASEAKSRFMAVMSHELRTPLTAVIGYANLLDEGIAGEQNAEAKGYVDRIRASGWHLVGLIDSVLLYASGKAPADEIRHQRVNVPELLIATAHMFEQEAILKSLTLRVTAGEPAWVITDLRKLRQIVINLLGNAVKFTDRGGIDVRVHANAEKVVIEIADTGIGISADHMAHIWEPFQQVDASHTRTRGGMGLGLALTQQLAGQIGAQLTAHSSPGAGSTFTIELPRAEEHAARAIGLNGARVLVVDDEAGVRRIMVRTLTRYGGDVTQAESAHEAITRMDEHGTFDALVTDISMPGMTGIELAQQLKAEQRTPPVLFVTGAELDADDHTHIAALNGRLLRKPFDMVELVRTVQLMTERG